MGSKWWQVAHQVVLGKSLFAATSGASGLHLYRVQYGHVHTSQQVYEDVIIISDCLHSLGIKNHTLMQSFPW